MIKLEKVGKIYSTGDNLSVGIRKVDLELHRGEFVAITGESGSGKSTLLNIISGIDSYEEGEMFVSGEETSYFDVEDLENYRNKYVGFIFQNYNIIDSYTVYENVETALMFTNPNKEERRKKAIELIERVGLKDRMNMKASKLSGGEKQRVVIARALSKDPMIIAADEPTGNLDSKSGKEIIDLIHEVAKDKLVLIVTHDFEEVKDYATRLIRVYDGTIIEDRELSPSNKEDIPNLFNDDSQKFKKKETFRLALKDLIASPKRLIFYSLVMLIMSFALLLYIAAYRFVVSDIAGGYTYSSGAFSNTDVYRLVLNKKDRTAFSAEELNTLKNEAFTDYIIENDILVDSQISSYIPGDTDDVYFSEYVMPSNTISKSDLTLGRLPESKYEVVYTIDCSDLKVEGFTNLSDYLDKEFTYYQNYYKDSGDILKIVGVIDGSGISDKEGKYIYLSDEYYKELLVDKLLEDYMNLFITFGEDDIESVYSIGRSDLLSGKQAYSPNMPYTSFSLVIKDIYKQNIKIDGLTPEDKPSSVPLSFGTLYVSNEVYGEITDKILENTYQVSIFLKNSTRAQKARQTLRGMGYNVVIPSIDQEESNILVVIVSIIYFISMIGFMVETFFIVFVILLHSIKSRREDVNILRTIGATRKTIRNMMSLEFSYIGIISYVVVTIIFLITKALAKGSFLIAINSVTFTDFIILFVAVLGINVLLSLFFMVTIFRDTVRKSLSKR